MAAQVQTLSGASTFLRRVLQANSGFSVLSALLCIVASAPLATFMGIDAPGIFLVLGVGLLGFAGGVYREAVQTPLRKQGIWLIFVMDVAWVVGSALLLLTNLVPLTTEGKWAILIIADIVAVFAILEYYGLRRLNS